MIFLLIEPAIEFAGLANEAAIGAGLRAFASSKRK
jgi:hypothetical protein